MTNPYYLPSLDYSQPQGQMGNVAASVAAGVGAGMTNQTSDGYFVPGTWDGLQAAGKGAAAGSAAGPMGAAIGAVTASGVETFRQPLKINKAIKNVNTSFDMMSYDAYGRPV